MNPNFDINLETPRLIIRELRLEDQIGMFELDSDIEVHRFLGNRPIQKMEQSLETILFVRQQYIDNGIGRWAIVEKQTNEFVGWTGFKLIKEKVNGHINFIDFGYRLKQKFWGLGYATEAGKAALIWGLEHFHFAPIYGMTDLNNKASRNVLEKLGFELIDVFDYDGIPNWRNPGAKTTWYRLKQE